MTSRLRPVVVLLAGAAVFVAGWQSIGAQAPQAPALDRLVGMPGVDQFLKMQAALQGPPAVVSGALTCQLGGEMASRSPMPAAASSISSISRRSRRPRRARRRPPLADSGPAALPVAAADAADRA